MAASYLEVGLKNPRILGFFTLELTAAGWQGAQLTRGGILGKNEDFLIVKITTYESKITLYFFCFLHSVCKHQGLVTDRLPG